MELSERAEILSQIYKHRADLAGMRLRLEVANLRSLTACVSEAIHRLDDAIEEFKPDAPETR